MKDYPKRSSDDRPFFNASGAVLEQTAVEALRVGDEDQYELVMDELEYRAVVNESDVAQAIIDRLELLEEELYPEDGELNDDDEPDEADDDDEPDEADEEDEPRGADRWVGYRAGDCEACGHGRRITRTIGSPLRPEGFVTVCEACGRPESVSERYLERSAPRTPRHRPEGPKSNGSRGTPGRGVPGGVGSGRHGAERRRSQASRSTPQNGGMAEVAGMRELKDKLQHDVLGPLRDPERYRRYGLTIPNGILLYGPPGCGKTYIAEHLAFELKRHYVKLIPSEVASTYVHGNVEKISAVFREAEGCAPSMVFIDELDALAPRRGEKGTEYVAEEVNELLNQLNNTAERGILVVAATNLPDKIDPALLRTGRFDHHILVDLPDREAREEILRLHLRNRPVEGGLQLLRVTEQSDGYSSSDLRAIVDDAARVALRANAPITEKHLLDSLLKRKPSITERQREQYRRVSFDKT